MSYICPIFCQYCPILSYIFWKNVLYFVLYVATPLLESLQFIWYVMLCALSCLIVWSVVKIGSRLQIIWGLTLSYLTSKIEIWHWKISKSESNPPLQLQKRDLLYLVSCMVTAITRTYPQGVIMSETRVIYCGFS